MHRVALAVVIAACHSPAPRAVAPPAPPAPAPLGVACPDASLLPSPAALDQRGPWPVGARTVIVDGAAVEVWYPARPGSERGHAAARYDVRTAMPPAEAAKIPDADNAWLPCDCARDLPVDDAHGPYPVVVFFHGAASFRMQSTFLATHWASRGFVVLAPDLPGVGLAAVIEGGFGFPTGTPLAMLDLVKTAPADDPLAFLRARLGHDVALVGHSLGAILAAAVTDHPEVVVRISLAGATTFEPAVSTLVLAGDHDRIADADGARAALDDPHRPTRVGVVRRAGHLAFTDLCPLGADRGGSLAIAQAHGVAIPEILAMLATDGCGPDDAPYAVTAPVIRALTAGVLEERLRCDPAATRALAAWGTDPRVEFRERLQ
ncbi:MAG: alpha/beta fold hydrolase [Proteobacteria bacterium]|nr:alpha/beta fold hydrolase [Pseudomonadota bacterium]